MPSPVVESSWAISSFCLSSCCYLQGMNHKEGRNMVYSSENIPACFRQVSYRCVVKLWHQICLSTVRGTRKTDLRYFFYLLSTGEKITFLIRKKKKVVIKKVEYLFLILVSFSFWSVIGCKVLNRWITVKKYEGWKQRELASQPVWKGVVSGKLFWQKCERSSAHDSFKIPCLIQMDVSFCHFFVSQQSRGHLNYELQWQTENQAREKCLGT